jgi:hypothetical protein
MVLPRDAFQMRLQDNVLESWREQIRSLEESLELLEGGIKEAAEMADICTDEWCQATEHVIDDLSNSVFSISEPHWAPEEDSKKLKDLRKRIHSMYSRYKAVSGEEKEAASESGGTPASSKRSPHLRVQEMIDCYATSDPLREMSSLAKEEDKDEAAIKWLALAVLHGINAGAKKISIVRAGKGEVKILAEYRNAELPSPGKAIGGNVLKTMRKITHIEGDKGKTPLVMGVRDGSLELQVEVKRDGIEERVTLKFPQ